LQQVVVADRCQVPLTGLHQLAGSFIGRIKPVLDLQQPTERQHEIDAPRWRIGKQWQRLAWADGCGQDGVLVRAPQLHGAEFTAADQHVSKTHIEGEPQDSRRHGLLHDPSLDRDADPR
jgi:hypothetical protein